jgi:alkylation response protein AidB-like acyl-CoA dehydrogenase
MTLGGSPLSLRPPTDRDAPTTNPGLLMARSLREVTRANAEASERERTLNKDTVEALWKSGLMQYAYPKVAGGQEPTVPEMLKVWEEMAWQDSSFGWIGIANFPSAAFAAAYLPDEGFAECFTAHDNRVTMGGQFFPNGQGQPVDGGYQITGAWNFGSGIAHCEFVAGGFFPMENGAPRMAPDGLPEMRVAVFPREEITITDGWYVQGLKATGSFDYNVTDVFVPEYRTYPLFTREPKRGGRAFSLGIMPITAAGHAAWALGTSRSTLDDVIELAKTTQRMGEPSTLAQKPTFQRNLAHHEGMWRAAWHHVMDTYLRVDEEIAAGQPLTPTMRADMRLAASYATDAAREVVQWCHLAAGTTAIREGCRLERAFRDMYTGTQHTFIGEKTYLDVATLMLGLAEDAPGL